MELVNKRYLVKIFKVFQGEMRPLRWVKIMVRPFRKKAPVSIIGGPLPDKLEQIILILPFNICYMPMKLVNNRYLVEILKVYHGEMRP